MAKRSDHSGGTALKTRPRAGRIVLWAVLAALLLGAVIGVVSLLGRPSGAETPENTAAPTAAPDTSGTPSETPLPEELREAPLSPEAEIAASAAVSGRKRMTLSGAADRARTGGGQTTDTAGLLNDHTFLLFARLSSAPYFIIRDGRRPVYVQDG